MKSDTETFLARFREELRERRNDFTVEELDELLTIMVQEREKLQKRPKFCRMGGNPHKPSPLPIVNGVLTFPCDWKTIDDYAFRGNPEIKTVILNDRITTIGKYAFSDCVNLTEVIFPSNEILLKEGCFSHCLSLENVRIPAVSAIPPRAFLQCVSLKSVILSDSVLNVYAQAFGGCTDLKSVQIRETENSRNRWGLTHIFSDAFYGCSTLTSVRLPPRLYIAPKAFRQCRSLKTIKTTGRIYERKPLVECNAEIVTVKE